MRKRRRNTAPTTPAGWHIDTETQINGRWLRPGTEFRVQGERGRFRFERHVTTSTSQWIDARTFDGRFRSFAPERIKTVHVKQRLRSAA